MEPTNSRKGYAIPKEAKEVNRCRSIAKDYWTRVKSYHRHYILTPIYADDFLPRFERFKKHVKLLEVLNDYSEKDLEIYEFDKDLLTASAKQMD